MRPHLLRILVAASVLSLSACGGAGDPQVSEGGAVQDTPTPAAGGAPARATATASPGNAGDASMPGPADAAAVGTGTAAGPAGQDLPSHERYPAAQQTCVARVAELSGTPAAELVVTGTARTEAGVEVRVQRQELRSAWTCQTDAQGQKVLGVQDGRAS